jgi:hypothetical protein
MRFESREPRENVTAPIPEIHEYDDTSFEGLSGRSWDWVDLRADEKGLGPTVVGLRGRSDAVPRPAQPRPAPRPQRLRPPAIDRRLGHATTEHPNSQPTGRRRWLARALSWVVACLIEGFALSAAALYADYCLLARERAAGADPNRKTAARCRGRNPLVPPTAP